MQAIDVDELVKQTYFGRGKKAEQIYPPNMMAAEYGKQSVPHDASALSGIAGKLPADQKTVTIGYDSSNPDNQLISNLIQTQLAAAGLTAKVQAYPRRRSTAGSAPTGSPRRKIMTYLGWPDAPSPYTWGHISWDADGGWASSGARRRRSPRHWPPGCRQPRRPTSPTRVWKRSRPGAG